MEKISWNLCNASWGHILLLLIWINFLNGPTYYDIIDGNGDNCSTHSILVKTAKDLLSSTLV
jgi:hypothetical protein